MKPDNLHQTLREWEIEETLPPRFQDRVWQRIARAEDSAPASLWNLLANRISSAFARPSMAASYLALLLLSGLLAGYWQARVERSHAFEQLGSRYVQRLDPYQAHH